MPWSSSILFWEWLVVKNSEGVVASIEKVGDELQAGEDELTSWAKERGNQFFLKQDKTVLPALTRVSRWVMRQDYDPSAISTFFQVADYWLIAHALAHVFAVVTHENPLNSTKKLKIPNACVGLAIRFVTPYEMLRRERARFVLGPFAR